MGTVRRYKPTTGELLQVFDAGTNSEGEPLLSQPRGIGFGPDDLLYVSSTGTDSVVRFDPATGEFTDVFVEFPDLNGQALTFVPTQSSAREGSGESSADLAVPVEEQLANPKGCCFEQAQETAAVPEPASIVALLALGTSGIIFKFKSKLKGLSR